MDRRDIQAKQLAQMKGIALALLGLAGLLYVVARALELRHPHPMWGYLAAFGEAAMVGAIADWFAVVALFRHPLGLPIPHTAIIPRNKARIGENLAGFICGNFLSTDQVLEKLARFDPASRLAQWLTNPAHAAQVGEHFVAAARYGLSALDDERLREFIRSTTIAGLQRMDVTHLAGQLLDVLTANRRHQALLDEALQKIAALLESENTQAQIAAMVTAEVKYLRFIGLDEVAGEFATRKIVAGVGRIIMDMGEDSAHPLRLRFDESMTRFINRLKEDPEFRTKGEAIKSEVLAHPTLSKYLHGLWDELLAWLHTDLAREDSTIRARISNLAQTLGTRLQTDTAMQQWINAQVTSAAPQWIERYREDIRGYIVARVNEWNTTELTDELERNVGRDLQFVRVNGTLVGGLVGILIYATTQWVRGM